MNQTSVVQLLKDTFSEWSEDKVPRLAAALAYYTAFALAPLLLIAISVAGLVFGREAASNQIGQQLSGLLGPSAAESINTMVAAAGADKGGGILASIIGIVTLLFAASGVFGELKDSLNTIWEVQPKPNQGFIATIKQRFFSFAMVVGVGFLLLVSLVLSTALGALGGIVAGDQADQSLIWKAVNFVVSFGVITLLFALIYKVLPDVKIQWRDVWIGALVTALLFTLGKAAIGWYLGRPGTTSTYGAAGSFVALLLWVYYSAQILFFGAEFTQVYAKAYGSQIEPAANAVPVTEEARAQQGIPRQGQLERTAQLQERQADGSERGGSATRADGSAAADSTELTDPKPAGAGALVGFLVGVVLGRRHREK
ncbi:MAG: YihY/virulence factor BrkB family protein [Roseiflexaceae bacterium]